MDESDERSSVADVAAAILNGTPIDWPAIEASASPADRELLEELRLLCTVADLHRDLPAAETDPASGTSDPPQYWGRLRLIERVGGGSFGDVYRAWDPRLRREVALKLIAAGATRDGRAAGFIREGRLLARVRHPGVVTIYDAERIGSRVGLSMEFVEGPTLEQQIRERGPASVDETVEIGIQLCAALTAAHEAGVLHRDVKAANVVIRPDGRVVLMDFGAGRELDGSETGDRAGTPMYVAPEVLGGQESTVRSDIYSLGVLLHHLLTASYPIPAKSLQELRETHARRGQDGGGSLNGLTGPLAATLARATAPAPGDRYESATALADALRAAGTPTPSRWRTALIGGAVSVVALAAAVWLVMRPPIGSAQSAVATAEPVRVAILPFHLVSDRRGDDVLREGMALELISRLQTFENVRVISAASVFSVDALRLTPSQIGERLKVSKVLVGQIARKGTDIVTEVRLLALPGERITWSAAYTEPFTQLANLHFAITQDLTRELGLTRAGGAQGWPTWNVTAHSLYVKGQITLDRMSRPGRAVALEYFKQALVHDPDYAPVHAAMADLYLDMFPPMPNLLKADAIRLATEAATRAMALNPNLPAAHVAAANLRSLHRDWAGAKSAYEQAVRLGPSDIGVRQQYAHWLSLRGEFREALIQAREAERIEPMSARAVLGVASVQRLARRWHLSLEDTARALALDEGYKMAHQVAGHNYQGMGQLPQAIAAFQRANAQGNLGNALALAGRVTEAREMIAQYEKAYERTRTTAADIAMIYTGLGEYDRALDWLERFEQDHTVWPSTFKVALVWDPLRPLPRFQAFLKRNDLLD